MAINSEEVHICVCASDIDKLAGVSVLHVSATPWIHGVHHALSRSLESRISRVHLSDAGGQGCAPVWQ